MIFPYHRFQFDFVVAVDTGIVPKQVQSIGWEYVFLFNYPIFKELPRCCIQIAFSQFVECPHKRLITQLALHLFQLKVLELTPQPGACHC